MLTEFLLDSNSLGLFPKLQFVGLDQIPSINFADDKLDVAEMMIFLFDTAENTGKRRKCWLLAGYQHFCLFPWCLPKPYSLGLLKVRIVWYS